MVTPWLFPVLLGAVLLAVLLGWLLPGAKGRASGLTWVANSAFLRSLKSYHGRMRLLRAGFAVAAVGLLAVAVASSALTARPVDRDERSEQLATRDIVLCLDVSGSMIEFGSEMSEKFSELVVDFEGERIALSVWNNASRLVFPLTDDYALVEGELEEAARALDFDLSSFFHSREDIDRFERFLTGTINYSIEGGSLIGDGLASCVFAFDGTEDQDRARSIIFVTDNVQEGEPVFELAEAFELATERDIAVHGLYAAEDDWADEEARAAYEELVRAHDGLYYEAFDPEAVPAIVDAIEEQQAVELEAQPEIVYTDRPDRWYPWLVIGLGAFLLVTWRLRV